MTHAAAFLIFAAALWGVSFTTTTMAAHTGRIVLSLALAVAASTLLFGALVLLLTAVEA